MKRMCETCKHWKFQMVSLGKWQENTLMGTCDVEVEVPSIYWRADLIGHNEGRKCPFWEPKEPDNHFFGIH